MRPLFLAAKLHPKHAVRHRLLKAMGGVERKIYGGSAARKLLEDSEVPMAGGAHGRGRHAPLKFRM
jgi:hypothetical protein